MKTKNRFNPSVELLEIHLAPSTLVCPPVLEIDYDSYVDTLAPGGGHSAPIILDPIPSQPPTVILA